MKKIFTIFGILILLLLAIYFVLVNKNIQKVRDSGGEATLRDYFPFGEGSGTRIKDVLNDISENITNNEPEGEELEEGEEIRPVLRKIYSGHVGGYTYVQREVFDGELETDSKIVSIKPISTFDKEIRLGTTGEDVKRLQQTLNLCPSFAVSFSGPGAKGQETTVAGQKTIDAINKFQLTFKDELLAPRNLITPTNTLDEVTRKKISNPFDCIITENQNNSTIPTKLAIRLIDKENGNISDIFIDSGDQYRVTNTTIPRVHEAFFLNNGKNILLRYLKDDDQTITTFYGTIPTQKLGEDISEAPLSGTLLEDNIKDISVSPDTTEAYLQTVVGENNVGILRNLSSKKQTIVWQNPFSEWVSQWVNKNFITLTTKASGYVYGYIYGINQTTGAFEKLLGEVGGLTTKTSTDGTKILFSQNKASGIKTSIYNIFNRKVYDISIETLPEKCIWTELDSIIYCAVPKYIPEGVYPDNWYQGVVSFEDTFWRIDVNRLLDDTELFNPNDYTGESIDAVDLTISTDKKYLLFKNKKDDSLWAYSLE